jgi:hypothetical protein
MSHLTELPYPRAGQAMVEALLSLPLILLMAGGIVHFTFLFLAKVQFEHACGEVARKYAAGTLDPERFPEGIFRGLGPFKDLFLSSSITVHDLGKGIDPVPGKKPSPEESLRKVHPPKSSRRLFPMPLDYGGGLWKAEARITTPRFFLPFFRDGLVLSTEFSVLRHPRGNLP